MLREGIVNKELPLRCSLMLVSESLMLEIQGVGENLLQSSTTGAGKRVLIRLGLMLAEGRLERRGFTTVELGFFLSRMN